MLELPDGTAASGRSEIREFDAGLLEGGPNVTPGRALPALIHGDLALTTTQIGDCQEHGSWRWILDRPNVRMSG
ncbi:hypothetical protein [Brevibacterium sandarakinum]|uniref:hypothetical protein n=1 Tax=Brevibacterium sandarakinum TaxID=629680 RepID=UPI0012FDEB6A|nr:hypothetical protein [Brevibacterium sandarakinum]